MYIQVFPEIHSHFVSEFSALSVVSAELDKSVSSLPKSHTSSLV